LNFKVQLPRPQVTSRGYPFWDTSLASTYLKLDIDNELHITMSKEDFHRSRAEYLVFPKEIFRKHILQEVNARLQTSYWLKKKEKKGKK
jgi:hypothetical protein